jgi:tetratricopeptide (TPR) repeat protein
MSFIWISRLGGYFCVVVLAAVAVVLWPAQELFAETKVTNVPVTTDSSVEIFTAGKTATSCQIPEQESERSLYIEAQLAISHSKEAVRCAAMASVDASDEHANNYALALKTVYAVMDYNDLLGSFQGGVGVSENDWVEANTWAERIADRVEVLSPNDPEGMVARATLILQLLQRQGGASIIIKLRKPKSLLEAVAEKAPATNNGFGLVVLGRMYFELPFALGGDVNRSIALFLQSLEFDANSMIALSYLAEAYDQEMEEEKALNVVRRMLELTPLDKDDEQRFADHWYRAYGIASRLGAENLAQAIKEKRSALLLSNSNLLTRKTSAINGHGGVNPLTGK